MNTNLLHRIRLYVCLALLGLAACTEQELPDTGTDIPTGTLRFRVADAATRVSYNGVSSTFDDGELIGCVIATKEGETVTYAANSQWHYTDGFLVLDEVFTWSGPSWDSDANANRYSKVTVSDIISRTKDTATESNVDDAFLTVQGNGTYVFHFYYPYVDDDLLREDFSNNYSSGNNNLMYPNIGSSTSTNYYDWMLTGPVSKNYSQSWSNTSLYAWTTYPCFVNHTQRAKEQINNSDFLWVASDEITASSTGTKSLTFEKKTATIEVYIETEEDEEVSDIYFQAKEDNSLRRGKQINLQTGVLSDSYTHSVNDWENLTPQEKYLYFYATEQILPYKEDGKYPRVVMPAQSSFPCWLKFTVNNKEQTIDLPKQLDELKEGYLYTIKVIKTLTDYDFTVLINDWKDDGEYELTEVDTATGTEGE